MEKIENILTDCLKAIRSGKATLAECLDRYPSHRQELEPLLKVALNIEEPSIVNMDSRVKQLTRARLLHQIQNTRQHKSKSFTDIISLGIPRQLVWARLAASIVTVIVVISLLTGGTVYASQDSVPGNLLYPVKTVTEDTRLLLAGNNIAKVELSLEFAQIRLVEMSKLANKNKAHTELAVQGLQDNLAAAVQHIYKISAGSTLPDFLDNAIQTVNDQLVYCDRVIDTSPKYMGPVASANDLIVNEQVELIEFLAQQDNVLAAQINLNLMKGRLQRAQSQAINRQYQTMQEVLIQYQQFNRLGERILQCARDTGNHNTEIENLTSAALTGYLDTLGNISFQAPQEYQYGIQTCAQETLQLQNKAREKYQKQGNPDTNLGGGSQESGNSPRSGPDSQIQNGNNVSGNNTSDSQNVPFSSSGNNAGETGSDNTATSSGNSRGSPINESDSGSNNGIESGNEMSPAGEEGGKTSPAAGENSGSPANQNP